jgi:uncharacterized protein YqfA (UPF0365 family)
MTEIMIIGVVIVAGIIGLIFVAVFLSFIKLWLKAILAKAGVPFTTLVAMRLRNVDPNTIVDARITAMKAGLPVTTDDLESHYLAGGNVMHVVRALVSASKANIDLDLKRATAIDLAGRDILDAVKTSVYPKVIDCPNPSSGNTVVAAVAMDGIQLKAKARVTVRTNLENLVGGATEETIVARVGEGIVTTIGSAESHKKVLENPDNISKVVLKRGLDAGTAFEILSIDIADIDVGDNIGAQLQIRQAEADKQIAQARAEERRAMAKAREQEMKALTQEMQAKVVESESEVPKAMAEAFRAGHMGIMDYYRMKNVMADTDMRDSIASPDEGPEHSGQ